MARRKQHGSSSSRQSIYFLRFSPRSWIALGLIAVAALLFYFFFIAPFVKSWRNIYGKNVVPAGYSIRGIDVSHHQGKIDWELASRAELGGDRISFAIVKATEGERTVDDYFSRNFREARENGLVRGAYHFFVPNKSATLQARNFIRHVNLEPGDLAPVLDIEKQGDLSADALQDSALRWLEIVENYYGVRPIIYTSVKFRKSRLNRRDFNKYPLWIAHYYEDKPSYRGEWKFWQHTDMGRIPGIKVNVDLNCYNGSMYDLRSLTVQGGEY